MSLWWYSQKGKDRKTIVIIHGRTYNTPYLNIGLKRKKRFSEEVMFELRLKRWVSKSEASDENRAEEEVGQWAKSPNKGYSRSRLPETWQVLG